MDIGGRKELCWAMGLDEEQYARIQDCLGPESVLRSCDNILTFEAVRREGPVAVFIAAKRWSDMAELHKKAVEPCSKVFVLSEDYGPGEMEGLFDTAAMGVLKPTWSPDAFSVIMQRCREHTLARNDLRKMSAEISLHREVFLRKSRYLDFVFSFFGYTGEHLEPVEILKRTAEGLGTIMPLESLQAVFWRSGQRGSVAADLFLGRIQDLNVEKQWQDLLLRTAGNMSGAEVASFKARRLPASGEVSAPDACRVMLVPMHIEEQPFGCLALVNKEEINMGRDQMELIHAAMAHLELAMYSALQRSMVEKPASDETMTSVSLEVHGASRSQLGS